MVSPPRTQERGSMCWAGHGEGEHGGIWASLSDVLTSTDGPQPRTGPPRRRRRARAPGPWHAAAGRKRSRGRGDAGPCHDACFARSEATRPRVSRSVSAGASRPRSGGGAAGLPAAQARTPHADSRAPHPAPTPPPPPQRGRVPSKARGPRARDARKVSAPPAKGHKTHGKTSVPKGPLKAAIIKHRWLLPEATSDGGSGAPALCTHMAPLFLPEGHAGRGMRCPTPKAPGGSAGCAQGPFSGRSNALSGGPTGQVCSVSFPSILMLTFPAAHRDAEHSHAQCPEPPRPPPPPAGAPAQHARPWRLLVAPGRTFHSARFQSPSDTEGRPGPASGIRNYRRTFPRLTKMSFTSGWPE